MNYTSWLVSIFLVIGSSNAVAETPEEFGRTFFAAVSERGLNAIPELTHPAELDRFKETVLPFFLLKDPASVEMRKEAFGSDATADTLRSMASAEFMRSFIRPVAKRFNDAGVKMGPSDVLGVVSEGELAHVLVRTRVSAGPANISQVEVLTVKRAGEVWRAMLSAQVQGLADALSARAKPGR
jgi:hypothetical protein